MNVFDSSPKNLNPQLTEREWNIIMLALAYHTSSLEKDPDHGGNELDTVPLELHYIGAKMMGAPEELLIPAKRKVQAALAARAAKGNLNSILERMRATMAQENGNV